VRTVPGATSLVLTGLVAASAAAQTGRPDRYAIAYEFASRTPATHMASVRLRATGALGDSTLIRLPAWYPGRYAIYNFAANVLGVHASCNGRAVPAPKRDKQTWVVRCPASRSASVLDFALQVWWDDLSGSTTQIDSFHVNVNPGNVFPYVVGHLGDSVAVTYLGPDGWAALNGEVESPGPGPLTQQFPNYDVFIDHPTEISARFSVDTFNVGGTAYRLVVHAEGDTAGTGIVRRRLVGDLRQLVTTEAALWGEQPMARYTFLVHFRPDNPQGGDGMEHLTSTQIIFAGAPGDTAAYLGRLETFAHEFFHTWSMKRLRARELGPWDYGRENYTPTLWVGEGFTNYYGARLLYRAGLWDRPRYLERVARAVARLQATPGRLVLSAEDASLSAWLFDAVPLRQQAPLRQSTVSYYTKGELLAWLLDLEIRSRTAGDRTLDDVMRLLWRRCWHGTTTTYYLPGHGYTDGDVLQALNDVTHTDFSDFFRRYVQSTEELPYGRTLAKVGLRLVNDAGTTDYRIEPDPDAAESLRRLGAGWLEGR
jgi:predicted metalloprotease with PDZ domain